MSPKVNKAAETKANGHALPGQNIGEIQNVTGVERPAEVQQDCLIESAPDPKKIREAVSAQTQLPDEEGRLKRKFWVSFRLPWTKKGLKEGGRRKWPRPSEPITNIEDVPEGWRWDPMDQDVDSDDIDGNIVRSKKRIKDGIMPQVFETRLSTYKMLRAHRDKLIASEKRGLSLNVVKRLDNLKAIEKSLEGNGDVWEELPNVKAIIKAYRSKKLKWSKNGEATYWFQGKQLCEPKKWNWSDIIKINQEVNGSKGFWVEGIDGPGPTGVFFAWSWTPDPARLTFQHHIQFEVRVPPLMGHFPMTPMSPGSLGWRGRFLDDTGSETVTIFDDDLDEIMNLAPQGIHVPVIGEYNMITAEGKSVTHRNIVLQARVIGPGEYAMTNWYSVRVAIWPASHKVDVPVRLSGNWWRHVLYVANAPDNRGHLYASTTKQDLCKMLPDVDFQQAQGPKNIPPSPPVHLAGAPPPSGLPGGPTGELFGRTSGRPTSRAPYGLSPGFPYRAPEGRYSPSSFPLRGPSNELPYAAPFYGTSFPPEYLVHGIYPEYPYDVQTMFQKGPFGSDPYTRYVPWPRLTLPPPQPATRPTSIQTQGQTQGPTEGQSQGLSEVQKGKQREESAPENDEPLIPGRTHSTSHESVTIESSGPSTLGSDPSTNQKRKQMDPGPEPAQPPLWGYFLVLHGQGYAPGWYYCPPPPEVTPNMPNGTYPLYTQGWVAGPEGPVPGWILSNEPGPRMAPQEDAPPMGTISNPFRSQSHIISALGADDKAAAQAISSQGALSPGAATYVPPLNLDPNASIYAPATRPSAPSSAQTKTQPRQTGISPEMANLGVNELEEGSETAAGPSEWPPLPGAAPATATVQKLTWPPTRKIPEAVAEQELWPTLPGTAPVTAAAELPPWPAPAPAPAPSPSPVRPARVSTQRRRQAEKRKFYDLFFKS